MRFLQHMLSHRSKRGECGGKLGQASHHSLAARTVGVAAFYGGHALLFNNCQDIPLYLLHQLQAVYQKSGYCLEEAKKHSPSLVLPYRV
jgi:hypothetical protein